MEEEGGRVERKQLVKTELLLKGGRAWGARDGETKGKHLKIPTVYCLL